jgi:predicted nucleic acid-binding protein
MIVVADSGPLHYLILLNQARLLHDFYGRVIVPDSVASELTIAAAPRAVQEWMNKPPSWVDLRPVSPDVISTVSDALDMGERAAIALATTLPADLLLIDEAAGRAEARRRRLRVTGTLGVLRAGAERAMVDVPQMIQALRNTSFYLDEALVNEVFARWLRT